MIRICDEENRGLLEAACSFIPEETFVKADLRDLTDDKKAVPAVPAADPDRKILLSSFYQRKYGNTESDRPHQCRYDRLHV